MQLFKVGEWIDRDDAPPQAGRRCSTGATTPRSRRGTFRVARRGARDLPRLRRDRLPDRSCSATRSRRSSTSTRSPARSSTRSTTSSVWPATHYVTKEETIERAVRRDRARARASASPGFEERGQAARGAPPAPAHRSTTWRCCKELGFCSGIENYSRILDGRPPGSPPHTLIDYFPDDFVCFIDESHQTIPQIGGMYEGDRSRKQTLVDYGFRLPSALDNRPLQVRRVPRPGRRRWCSSRRRRATFERGHVDADRRADRAPDRDRRPGGRGARDQATRSTT